MLKSDLLLLYIEDNPDDAFVFSEFLHHIPKKISVDVVGTLQEAKNILNEKKYDVIVADLSLPDSKGLQSIETLIKLDIDTPVVALTGFLDDNLALDVLRAGAQDYLVKGEYNDVLLDKTFSYAMQRHKMLKEVVAQQKLLTQAQKIAQMGSFEYDFVTDEYKFSPELANIFGLDDKVKLKSKHYWRTIYPEDIESVRSQFLEHFKTQAPFTIIHRIVMPSGMTKYIMLRCESEFNEQGRCFRTIGTAQDVTKERRASDLLKQSQERLNLATRAGQIGIFDWEVTTNQVFCDDTVYDIYDIDDRINLDNVAIWIECLHPDNKEEAIAQLTYLIKKKENFELQLKLLTPKNNVKYILALADFEIKEEKVVRVVGVVMDITARMEADRIRDSFTRELEISVEQRTSELNQAQKDLEIALSKEKELSRLKSHFVSTASHQFRTPLSIIQSNIELIDMLTEGIESKNNVLLQKAQGRIQKEVERMTELMNDVLLLGNLTDNKKAMHFVPGDIVNKIKKIQMNLESIQADNREIAIDVKGDPKPVYIDLSTMDHALENLVSNAFKYSNTNPKVEIHFNPDMVEVKVIDYGIGIPEDEIDLLFQTFHRGSNVKNIPGTGLGLAIVKEYVELNFGTIDVQSKLKEGTTFEVKLHYYDDMVD